MGSESSDDDNSRDQPLDLSPAKKLASRENNPLLNQPPLPIQPTQPSLTIQPTQLNPVRELVEQKPASSHDEYPGTWKKQKTSQQQQLWFEPRRRHLQLLLIP